LNNQCLIEEIRKEIKKVLNSNENEDKTYQNLWDKAMAVLIEKLIAMSTHIRNKEISGK
jgi:hypothetical protein